MASEVSTDDLKELYEAINRMSVDIAVIKTKLENQPLPPKRPCPEYEQLRKEFDEFRLRQQQQGMDLRSKLIGAAIDLAKVAMIAGIGFILGKFL